MAHVRANERGYFGGELREAGEVFAIPDDVMDDKKRAPKWVSRVSAREAADASDDDQVRKPRARKQDRVAEALPPEPDWVPPSADGPVMVQS